MAWYTADDDNGTYIIAWCSTRCKNDVTVFTADMPPFYYNSTLNPGSGIRNELRKVVRYGLQNEMKMVI